MSYEERQCELNLVDKTVWIRREKWIKEFTAGTQNLIIRYNVKEFSTSLMGKILIFWILYNTYM